MAWTVKKQGPMIELTPDGSTNFVWATYFPESQEGVLVQEIQVYFAAANDKIDIRTHSTTGPSMFTYTTLDGTSVAKRFYKGLFKPVIVDSEQTSSGGAHASASWKILIQTT